MVHTVKVQVADHAQNAAARCLDFDMPENFIFTDPSIRDVYALLPGVSPPKKERKKERTGSDRDS